MSIFKKMLASIGIGAAKVDTRLYDDYVIPGGLLNGEVDVTGGNVSQEIDEIYLYVATQYKRESGDGYSLRHGCADAPHTLTLTPRLKAYALIAKSANC